jgi:hypothetical protein
VAKLLRAERPSWPSGNLQKENRRGKPTRRKLKEIPLAAAITLIYQPSVKIRLDDGASFAGMRNVPREMPVPNAGFSSFQINHSRLTLNS